MPKVSITFACGLYDRMLALYTGEAKPDGIDLNFLAIDDPRQIFDRMGKNLEFDACEMSSSEVISRQAALASEASGQRGNSIMRAHSASEDARKRADDTRPEPGSSARAALGAANPAPIARASSARDGAMSTTVTSAPGSRAQR